MSNRRIVESVIKTLESPYIHKSICCLIWEKTKFGEYDDLIPELRRFKPSWWFRLRFYSVEHHYKSRYNYWWKLNKRGMKARVAFLKEFLKTLK